MGNTPAASKAAMAPGVAKTRLEGQFRVVECVAVGEPPGIDAHHMLGAVESQSNHPIAEALTAHAIRAELPGQTETRKFNRRGDGNDGIVTGS